MGKNKVIYYGEVLVDMSQVTVTPDTLGKGVTALDAQGDLITGLHECKETEPKLQAKTVTPSASLQTVNPDSGYDGLSKVTVNGDENLKAENIASGVSIFGVTGTHSGAEDLDNVLTEQESLIAELQDVLKGKASGGGQYETWTITYTDGTIEEQKVVLL